MSKLSPKALTAAAKKVKLVLTDVDGVLTSGLIYHFVDPVNGELVEFKGVHTNDSISLALRIDGQQEADRIWNAITREGTAVNCGWCRDQFGVTWQVSPIQMDDWLQHPDKETREYAWEAMGRMQRIIIDDLHR